MIDTDLIESARQRTLILFIGSGVSVNLGLPPFDRLTDLIAEELGYAPDVFKLLGSYQELAEYYQIEKLGLGLLRSKLDREWHGKDIDIENSYVHRLIPEVEAPLVYTTNYDRWIEAAYDRLGRPYQPIVTVADTKKIREGVTQIVKFHGDFSEDASLVLTESSYFERLDFESPLDIKLRADALGRSILFLGYSLRDINIRLLMFKLNKLWEASELGRARPRSYIVLWRSNPVQEAVLRDRGIEPVVTDGEDAGQGLANFLQELVATAHGKSISPDWDR